MKHDTTIHDGIRASLKALHQILITAAKQASEASGYIDRNQQNAAIGTIIPLEDMLEQVAALYRATLALHRFKPVEGTCE
ncbi:hypothetical protein SAMN02745166_03488 [Prosthecobacter debontii]|uniref:Uncharacterized protein n=1 Tax=Prosthecobacter debontii TaxID=48467 RepID=A0A1T4YJD8_9BACT|nr:hypothetical protein [Prosthecobacter debontii]SKB01866.1 hypothetical protein SAMN02745166_03488 [Prosthecobacter debontii]